MKAFIQKNKKALIIGGIVLAAGLIWYFKFRKPTAKIVSPPTVKESGIAGSAATIARQNTQLGAAEAIQAKYKAIAKPTANDTAVRDSQLKGLGFKVVNDKVVSL